MSTIPMKLPRQLAEEDVINVLDYARQGISYWAASSTVDAKLKTCRVIVRDFMRELLPEDDVQTEMTLTFDQIRDAYSALVASNQLPKRSVEHDDIGFYVDVADRTVQQAMFGAKYVG